MIRFIYNLLFLPVLFFFLPGYLVKMFRRGGYRENFAQRLGIYERATRTRLARAPHTWMHAVSVGEVLIALKLAAAMKKLDANLRVALTTTTTTAFPFARQQAPEWIEVLYAPLDFWPIARRAFAGIRPQKMVLVEAEVWPNLSAFAHRRRIPLALVNARLSPRSERRFRKFNRFVRPIFRQLDLVCVPEAEDVERWISLGLERAKIKVVGSIKFDPQSALSQPTAPREVLRVLGVSAERPILLAGSTHAGEEAIVAQTFRELRAEFPQLFLIVAPRHVERTAEIFAELDGPDLKMKRRSEASTAAGKIDCLLLDTTGELRDWYGVATVVFIGKSLRAHGGQNPVEAIVANRPLIFGPHMENFSTLAANLIENGGALQANDEIALTKSAAKLLRDQDLRSDVVRQARLALTRHEGATERTAKLLAELKSAAAEKLLP